MAIVGSGYDRDVGGAQGVQETIFGVPSNIWDSWSQSKKDLYLQDYTRSDAESEYYTMEDKSLGYQLSYLYTGITDAILGTDAVATGEKVNDELIPQAKQTLETGKDITKTLVILGVLYLALK